MGAKFEAACMRLLWSLWCWASAAHVASRSAVGHLWGICGEVPLDQPQWRARERRAHLEDAGGLSVSGLTPAAESNALSVLA